MAHSCCRWRGVFEETVKRKGREFYVAPERPDILDAAWQHGLLTLKAVEGVEKGLLKEGSEARKKFDVLISRYPNGVPLVPPTARHPAHMASTVPVQPPAAEPLAQRLTVPVHPPGDNATFVNTGSNAAGASLQGVWRGKHLWARAGAQPMQGVWRCQHLSARAEAQQMQGVQASSCNIQQRGSSDRCTRAGNIR